MNFRELIERLMIVKKGNKTADSRDLGKIGKYNIETSKHISDVRSDNIKRNDNLSLQQIKSVLSEFINHFDSNIKSGKYDIVYKMPKLNKMVVFVSHNKIKVITIIQSQRNKNTYAVQKAQTQVELKKLFEDTQIIEAIYFTKTLWYT